MIVWSQQPVDAANMFNPAFVGELIRRICQAYVEEADRDMPLALAFLAVPLALYPDSRRALRRSRYKFLHTWVTENPEVRIALAQRCRELAPFIRTGLAFALAYHTIEVGAGGGIRPMRRIVRGTRPAVDSSEYFTAGRTFGRLFARVAQDFNIFVMLGVDL